MKRQNYGKALVGVLTAALILSAGLAGAQSTWYVTAGGAGDNSGDDWLNANDDLQAAINGASDGDEVWVAGGQYDLTVSLGLKTGVGIYGGFASGDANLGDRDWVANPTTISQQSNVNAVMPGNVGSTGLDGFIITHAPGATGSGIYQHSGSPTYANCVITRNTSTVVGGVSFSGGSTMRMENCVVKENYGTNVGITTCGGGIRVYNCRAIITGTTVTLNRTDGHGGGVAFYSNGAVWTPQLIDCVVSDNTADRTGGGVLCHKPIEPTIQGCVITGNTASASTSTDGYEGGGGLYCDESVPDVDDCEITSNVSFAGGGGVGLYLRSDVPLDNCVISGNTALGTMNNSGGGGILIRRSAPVVTGCTISGNTAVKDGGGVRCYVNTDGDAIFYDCDIVENFCDADGDLGGGGVYCEATATVFALCDITSNTVDPAPGSSVGGGGGFYGYNTTNAILTTCTLNGNTSAASGGGALYQGALGSVTFLACELNDNAALAPSNNALGGGGLRTNGGVVTLRDCVLSGNTAVSRGGAVHLYASGGQASFYDCSLLNNTSAVAGGGLSSQGPSFVIDGCAIAGNRCTSTGPQTSGGGIWTVQGTHTITSSVISGNRSRTNGGGMNIYTDANVTIENCIVSGNTAENNSGGGVCAYGNCTVTIANSTICDNEIAATGNAGGGVQQNEVGGNTNVTLVNCILANNDRYGYYDNAAATDPVIDNCLFYGNAAGNTSDDATLLDGDDVVGQDPAFVQGASGAWASGSYNAALNLSTITANGAPFPADGSLAGGLVSYSDTTRRQAYIVSNTASALTVVGDVEAEADNGDDFEIVDYRLTGGSAAIDAGTATGATTVDILGAARPVFGKYVSGVDGYDIGAYEYLPDAGLGPASAVGAWTRY